MQSQFQKFPFNIPYGCPKAKAEKQLSFEAGSGQLFSLLLVGEINPTSRIFVIKKGSRACLLRPASAQSHFI